MYSLILFVALASAYEEVTFDETKKAELVAAHNAKRSQEAISKTASNMECMEWDDTLAASAKALASTCVALPQHSEDEGQNIFLTVRDWLDPAKDSVDHWYAEVADYTGTNNVGDMYETCNEGMQCGHYTQVKLTSSS